KDRDALFAATRNAATHLVPTRFCSADELVDEIARVRAGVQVVERYELNFWLLCLRLLFFRRPSPDGPFWLRIVPALAQPVVFQDRVRYTLAAHASASISSISGHALAGMPLTHWVPRGTGRKSAASSRRWLSPLRLHTHAAGDEWPCRPGGP